jgi:nicotinamide riboside kinase
VHKQLRISITGPESSGKTTLAFALSKHLGIPVVEEYARHWLNERNGQYTKQDLDTMAQGQYDWTHNPSCSSIISDTDLFVFDIWSTEKYGAPSNLITSLTEQQNFHCYFLCKPDIPWEPDPLREHPKDRQRLFEQYHILLQKKSLPFCILEGSIEQRIAAGISYLNDLDLI